MDTLVGHFYIWHTKQYYYNRLKSKMTYAFNWFSSWYFYTWTERQLLGSLRTERMLRSYEAEPGRRNQKGRQTYRVGRSYTDYSSVWEFPLIIRTPKKQWMQVLGKERSDRNWEEDLENGGILRAQLKRPLPDKKSTKRTKHIHLHISIHSIKNQLYFGKYSKLSFFHL